MYVIFSICSLATLITSKEGGELLPEGFVYMRLLTYSREYEGTLGSGPLERNIW